MATKKQQEASKAAADKENTQSGTASNTSASATDNAGNDSKGTGSESSSQNLTDGKDSGSQNGDGEQSNLNEGAAGAEGAQGADKGDLQDEGQGEKKAVSQFPTPTPDAGRDDEGRLLPAQHQGNIASESGAIEDYAPTSDNIYEQAQRVNEDFVKNVEDAGSSGFDAKAQKSYAKALKANS